MGQIRHSLCALLCMPYFLVLLLSFHAPKIPLPVPRRFRSGSERARGWEISRSLRTASPHLWPHPIWALLVVGPVLFFLYRGSRLIMIVLALEALGAPILAEEKYVYLRRLRVFVKDTERASFGAVYGWRTCLYSLYLSYVAQPSTRDFGPLEDSDSRNFLPEKMPQRKGDRPSIIRVLPMRQKDQNRIDGELVNDLAVWSRLLDCAPCSGSGRVGNLNDLRGRMVFDSRFKRRCEVAVDFSPNEGPTAKAMLCLDTKTPEILALKNEFAREHCGDGTWQVSLTAADALQVCELGWAERAPPYICKSFWQPHFDDLPLGTVMVYSPRTAEEVEVLKTILEAAHNYALNGPETPRAPHLAAAKLAAAKLAGTPVVVQSAEDGSAQE